MGSRTRRLLHRISAACLRGDRRAGAFPRPAGFVWVSVAWTLLLLSVNLPGLSAVSAPPMRELGTVETVAGPGYCPGPAEVDRDSASVRSLAVDTTGALWFDTGPVDEGALGQVDPAGRSRLLRVGPPPTSSEGRELPLGLDSLPDRLAPDRSGGVYVVSGTTILHADITGIGLTRVAGNSNETAAGSFPRPSGDGGPAVDAVVAPVASIASDEVGNLFIAAEPGAPRGTTSIRVVNRRPDPLVFFAGTTQETRLTPGNIGTVLEVTAPRARRDGPAGIDEAPTFAAMAVSGQRLYLASYGAGEGAARLESRVEMTNLSGDTMTAHGVSVEAGDTVTVAGGTPAGFGGDGGPALAASFSRIIGVAADDQGNLYLVDRGNHRIRRVDSAGVVSTFAGTGDITADGGFNGNGRPATEALLDHPYDVQLGPNEAVYIADEGNHQVRVVDATGTIRSAPGGGVGLTWRCQDDEGSSIPDHPSEGKPTALAVDEAGAIYVATTALSQIKVLDGKGSVTTGMGPGTEAPRCETKECSVEVPLDRARLERPIGLAARPGGGLYVLDGGTSRVSLVNLGSDPISAQGVTVPPSAASAVVQGAPSAGTESTSNLVLEDSPQGSPRDDTGTPLSGISSLDADSQGNLFLTDDYGLRQVDANGRITTLIEAERTPSSPSTPLPPPEGRGDRITGPGADLETISADCCGGPQGVAVDGKDNLYVAGGNRVWFLNRGSEPVEVHGQVVPLGATRTVAGNGASGFGGDGGLAIEAQLGSQLALLPDDEGGIYIADWTEHLVRRVDAAGTIETVLGTGNLWFSGDGTNGRLTSLNEPTGLALDRCGNLLVADQGNDRVRRLVAAPACDPGQRNSLQGPVGRRASGTSLVLLVTLAVSSLVAALAVRGRLAIRRQARL